MECYSKVMILLSKRVWFYHFYQVVHSIYKKIYLFVLMTSNCFFPVLFSLFVWFKCEYLPLISTLLVLDCSQYVATDKKDTIKLICWSSLLFWKVVTSDFFCFRRLVGGFKHLTLAIALSNLRLMETPSIKYYLQPSNILLWETTE